MIIILIICGVILAILIALFIYFFTSKSEIKFDKQNELKKVGEEGESVVASLLSNLDGFTINKFKHRSKDNRTHEIDHLFINQSGVFVIETKRFAGVVNGKYEDSEWVFTPFDGRPSEKRRNPIDQNIVQKNLITDLIKINVPIYSCVVYVTGDISQIQVENVLTINELEDFIKSKQPAISVTAVNNITKFLKSENDKTISDEQHINNIKKHHN